MTAQQDALLIIIVMVAFLVTMATGLNEVEKERKELERKEAEDEI